MITSGKRHSRGKPFFELLGGNRFKRGRLAARGAVRGPRAGAAGGYTGGAVPGSRVPGAGLAGVPRRRAGGPRAAEAAAGGTELASPPSSGRLGKSLGRGWAVRCPGWGVAMEGEADEISTIAPKCSQEETFLMVNYLQSDSFPNSICQGCGGESAGWWLLSEPRPRNPLSK